MQRDKQRNILLIKKNSFGGRKKKNTTKIWGIQASKPQGFTEEDLLPKSKKWGLLSALRVAPADGGSAGLGDSGTSLLPF